MRQPFAKRLKILILILASLLAATGCLPGGSSSRSQSPGAASEPEIVTVQGDIVFGPGALAFPDTRAGLAALSGYEATLTISFDGTRDGRAERWSRTYAMLVSAEPATRQLTIQAEGDLPDLEPAFLAEADGTAYERRGERACAATVIHAQHSLGETYEPAGFLTGVFGADAAGSETINNVATDHYTFDERALGQSDVAKSTGELWIATEGGYLVKYLLATTGTEDYFGAGTLGTLKWDYALSRTTQPAALELPADCPAGMVDAPQLPDASNLLAIPSLLRYDTTKGVADAVAFYEEEMPALGWKLLKQPAVGESIALMEYQQDGQNLMVVMRADAGVTTISILLERAPQ